MEEARIPVSICWLRRDLRLDDHAALYAAAQRSERVVVAFVLDPPLLRGDRVGAPIVQSFFDALGELRVALRALGSDLALLEGDFATELGILAQRVGARAVFYNVDYDPAAVVRDAAVTRALRAAGCSVESSVDHVYAAADEVLQDGGSAYRVYTPYRRRWMARFEAHPKRPYPSQRALRGRLLEAAAIGSTRDVPRPEDYGHASSHRYPRGGMHAAEALLATFLAGPVTEYAEARNIPSAPGTSRLSPHLRAGTIGIRHVVHALAEHRATAGAQHLGDDTWLGELIWRDFYAQLLVHHPHVAAEPFLSAAQTIPWRDDAASLRAWERGETGYPIVDAAMAQLNTTGWMHNRLRMIVASFLTKHLLVDYRLGERYFEQRLADADLAANNGGWQWAASTGTDAAPYFRVFNPVVQGRTFDADGAFVREWLPALRNVPARYVHAPWEMPPLLAADAGYVAGSTYPAPIVEHATARERAITTFGAVLGRKPPLAKPVMRRTSRP